MFMPIFLVVSVVPELTLLLADDGGGGGGGPPVLAEPTTPLLLRDILNFLFAGSAPSSSGPVSE